MVFSKEDLLSPLKRLYARMSLRRGESLDFGYRGTPYVEFQNQTFSKRLGPAISNAELYADASHYQLKPDKEVVSLLRESKDLTPFGEALKNIVKGRRFIDLGCGDPTYSRIPRLVAQAFNAKEYIGVDSELPQSTDSDTSGFPVEFEKTDMLSFLNGLKKHRAGIVFHLAGIEPVGHLDHKAATAEYTDRVLKRMQRLTRKGDAIIIGEATIGFDPSNYGFELVQTATRLDRFNEEKTSQRLFIKR